MNEGYKILCLDQSMRSTGWAIFEDGELWKWGTFTIPAHKPIEQRLQMIISELNNIITNFPIREVFFEDIQKQANIETYKKLAFVQAAIMIWCYNNDLKFTILAPSHWRGVLKSAFNGYGFGRARVEQKQKAIEFCKNFLDVEVSSDEADAICLGKAGLIENASKRSAF